MQDHTPNIAVFADFENVAIGARDAGYGQLDIGLVLTRLLDKGKILVKKAYADWSRFDWAKKPMHEAAFELFEVPKTSYSGKNSADIRLVVDALDLCYTKPHIDLVAIVSGDSDFSPLVNKLRENGKDVIGIGVKNSTSDLLIENCDEFIYYDDLIRRKQSTRGRGRGKKPASGDRSATGRERGEREVSAPESGEELERRRAKVMDDLLDVVEALIHDRDDVWGSHVKQVLRRKLPHFTESYYGYRSFNQLLEEARKRGLLLIEKDPKSGGYLIRDYGPSVEVER